MNGDIKYQVDMTSATMTMGTYHFLDGERVRIYYRGNIKTCGRCHLGPQLCKGGGIARECQNEGGVRKDLIEHMKEVWLEVGFCPTSFTIPEAEADDDDENLGGDQKILNLANFPRQVNQAAVLTETESEKFTQAKINNLPKEISEAEVLALMNGKVDKAISLTDLEILRCEKSSQVILGPGPSKAIVLKAIDTLDFHKSQNCFYEDRRLYVKQFKPLSPVKQLPPPANQPDKASIDNKVQSAIDTLESKKDNKTPVKPKTTSQAKKASATTVPITKYKQGLSAGISKK